VYPAPLVRGHRLKLFGLACVGDTLCGAFCHTRQRIPATLFVAFDIYLDVRRAAQLVGDDQVDQVLE
jgi:hypothetical protein